MQTTPEMRAKSAQLGLFALLRRPNSPDVSEILQAVRSAFSTADLAKNRIADIVKASALFSSRNQTFCEETADKVAKALHGDRPYSHQPWVRAAYNVAFEAGRKHGFAMLTADECVALLLETA